MFRYAILYVYGGVYADADAECLRPLSSWVDKKCDLIVGLENDIHFCQWTIAAAPRHPFLKELLREIVATVKEGGSVDVSKPHFVHDYTGPGIFTRSLKASLRNYFRLSPKDDPSKGWNARQWLDYVNSTVVDSLSERICLHDAASFNSFYVRNNYASQQDFANWTSWTTAANSLRAEYTAAALDSQTG